MYRLFTVVLPALERSIIYTSSF